jgi:phosphate transport system protein
VGDEACGIAKLATAARRMPGSLRRSIGHLGKAAGELLEQASEALLAGDAVAASALIGATERVDSESELLLREFISYFMEGGPQPGPVAESTLVLRALQRIADHATNLCEHTVYMATGSDPRRDRLPAERP